MNKITWLDLSDLHLTGTETSVHRGIFSEMLSDINNLLDREGLDIDAVFFTGDVVFSGHQDQYQKAASIFDEILEACNLPGQRHRFFIVPGNHDVDRKVVHEPSFVHSQYEDFARALLDPDKPYKEINEFLGDDAHRAWAFAKFHNFETFIRDFFPDGDMKFDNKRYYSVRSIAKGRHTVVVIGLNSAWLSFRNSEQGRLLIGERQVCDALEEAQDRWSDARLCITLLHHPLYWLAEKDIHKVQQYLPKVCDLLLRGHLHCPSFSIQITPDSHLYEFAAGASLQAEWHAYNLVQLDLDTGQGTAIVRLQHPEWGGVWGPDSFTYQNAEDGKITFQLMRVKAKL